MDLAREMASLPELQSLTFENNIVQDEDAICALFTNLRGFERLENLNIRQNDFTFNMVNALATGIQDKRELRVSTFHLIHPYSILAVSKLIVFFLLLQTVDLGENKIDDRGAQRLAEALR